MWDLVDENIGYDPGAEGVYQQPATDPYGTGVDQYGNPTGEYAPSTFTGDTANTGYSYDNGLTLQDIYNYGKQGYGLAKQGYGLLKDYKGLIGAGLGAILGSQNGAKPGGTITTTQGPWGPQQPYLQALFPGASQVLGGTLAGNFLTPDSNPYLKSYGQALADQVGANVDSRFESAGRYGGGLHAAEVAKQIGNTLSGLYGTAYTNERALQNNTASGLLSKDFGAVGTQPYFINPLGGALSGAVAGAGASRAW